MDIPAERLTVITGVSGSGKSSLAFDTLYAEGQRRYVESLSAYARQFLERINKPQVREIIGIRPAIAIRQKNSSRNPRSTVGTVTEIYDYLRLLYSRIGIIRCHGCDRQVKRDTVDEAVEKLLGLPEGSRTYVSFPFQGSLLDLDLQNKDKSISLRELLENMIKHGFHRLMIGKIGEAPIQQLPDSPPSSIEELKSAHILVDRLVIRDDIRDRLTESLETCYSEGNGIAQVSVLGDPSETHRFTERFECQHCNIPYRALEPRLFSFNNPYGACPTCHGFGNTITLDPGLVIPYPEKSLGQEAIEPFTKPRYRRFQKRLESWAVQNDVPLDVPFEQLSEPIRRKVWEGEAGFPGIKGFFRYLTRKKYKMHVRIFISRYRGYARCPDCDGERLRREARDVYVGARRIAELTALPISEAHQFFSDLEISPSDREIAGRLLLEIRQRLNFLIKTGLDYLTLDRLTSTLSGGEMQRIQLSASLSSSLVGTLYILDEPSIGLHPRDEHRLIEILKDLRDLGNTIVVVEHEKEMIKSADRVIDIGPGAGELGGKLIHQGDLSSLMSNSDSLTGKYLAGCLKIPIPVFRRSAGDQFLTIEGAAEHNLKNLSLRIPLGVLVCITGVSGSGKSTLVQDILYPVLKKLKGEWKEAAGKVERIEGWEKLGEVVLIDQAPIGKTPRSNPVTYIKAFDEIRQIFASVRESRSLGLTPGHFSFNVPGGRCDTCQGSGSVTVEMQFLADVELECEDCKGKRYKKKILEITYKGRNIAEVLDLTVNEAIDIFKAHSALIRKLRVLQEVGLGYLRLGQSATTLSGGEAQRIKLTSYLSKQTSKNPLFILDEPTTGLHFDDINKLLRTFDRLISQGATVIVIEHNLDVIKCADWIIDLGPEGGEAGGRLVAEGPPEQLARSPHSHTGKFLKEALES